MSLLYDSLSYELVDAAQKKILHILAKDDLQCALVWVVEGRSSNIRTTVYELARIRDDILSVTAAVQSQCQMFSRDIRFHLSSIHAWSILVGEHSSVVALHHFSVFSNKRVISLGNVSIYDVLCWNILVSFHFYC